MKVLPKKKNQDLEFLKCNGQEEIFRFWEDLNTMMKEICFQIS